MSKSSTNVHLLNQKHPTKNLERIRQGLRRVPVTIRLNRTFHTVAGALSLLDIQEEGVPVFTEALLTKGSPVSFIVEGPVPFRAAGVVAWSLPLPSRILTSTLHFRSGIQFIFANEEERAAAHKTLELLRESHPGYFNAAPAPAPAEKSDGNELVKSVNELMTKKAA